MTVAGRSNCLLWALLLYLRRRAKGRQGYIMLRRSRWALKFRSTSRTEMVMM